MNNVIDTGNSKIVIQSCQADWANIGVFHHATGKSLYRHVAIPSLEVTDTAPVKVGDLQLELFSAELLDVRDRLLSKVKELAA